MDTRALAAALLLFALGPCATFAASEFTALHPEEAIPDSTDAPHAGPYSEFIGRVQERLRELGFAPGPANGDFGAKTQAALAQFQLSRTLPASGQLDDETLAELGVARAAAGSEDQDAAAAAGSSSLKP